ncbi:MAG TPA: 3-carboxymuconate cyclase [Micromonosporaceae bacterium]|nr:3-carboxymuconate cyclase [Micromonosporaceae bacterium]HCU49383.1 3-carboxymuconate cyclase [Micromonosporaceae bacterium]
MIYIGSYGSQVTVWPSGDGLPCEQPSFIGMHPRHEVLYAISELAQGAVTAFPKEMAPQAMATGGSEPCHVAVHPDGDLLVVAHYGDGSIALIRLDDKGLPVGSPTRHDFGGAAHMVQFDATGRLLVSNLKADRIHRLDRSGQIVGEVTFAEGSGPRHFGYQEPGQWFVAFELDGTIGSYQELPDGSWHEVSRLPASESGPNYPSHIEAHGGNVYIANRGPDTISVFAADAEAALTRVGEVSVEGQWPRHFALDGDQLLVANQRSDNVAKFRLDKAGLPEFEGDLCRVPSPSCVLIRP